MLRYVVILGLTLIVSWSAAPNAAQADCYGWADARHIIKRHKLVPLRQIRRLIARNFGGKLIRARLCERAGLYVYDLVVLGPRGKVHQVTVDGVTADWLELVESKSGRVLRGEMAPGPSLKPLPPMPRRMRRRWKRRKFRR